MSLICGKYLNMLILVHYLGKLCHGASGMGKNGRQASLHALRANLNVDERGYSAITTHLYCDSL